jgi:hypothetical protein
MLLLSRFLKTHIIFSHLHLSIHSVNPLTKDQTSSHIIKFNTSFFRINLILQFTYAQKRLNKLLSKQHTTKHNKIILPIKTSYLVKYRWMQNASILFVEIFWHHRAELDKYGLQHLFIYTIHCVTYTNNRASPVVVINPLSCLHGHIIVCLKVCTITSVQHTIQSICLMFKSLDWNLSTFCTQSV